MNQRGKLFSIGNMRWVVFSWRRGEEEGVGRRDGDSRRQWWHSVVDDGGMVVVITVVEEEENNDVTLRCQ